MKLFFKSNKPTGHVFDYLADMQKFATVHPVITKIDKLNDGSYLIYETLKFLGSPFSFTYTAAIESQPLKNTITMHATVMNTTKIEMTFVIKTMEDFTLIEEDIVFKSPFPVKSILKNIFKKQHEQLFKNIELIK